ncbi:MAG: hypothetical protein AAFY24_24780 [Pseudomonadota bacterium]
MKKLLTISLATLGAFTVFASGAAEASSPPKCENLPAMVSGKEIRTLSNEYQYGPLTLIFNGEAVVVKGGSFVNRREMRKLLRSISPRAVDINASNPNKRLKESPKKWIERLIGATPNPDDVAHYRKFVGTEGILNYTWVRAAQLFFLNESNDRFYKLMEIVPHGRIVENGYVYDRNTKSGSIKTEMCFEITSYKRDRGDSDGDGNEDELIVAKIGYIRYIVNVAVTDGFEVHRRTKPNDDNYDEDDVFPGSLMKFSDSMVPSWAKSKLEARNVIKNGMDSMKVTEIFIETNVDGNTTSWYPFMPEIFKRIGDEGCIDIFFRTRNPPTTLATDWRPRYCMGRCTDPAIVNSGL